MQTYLTLDDQLRTETDPAVIATLLRKGWIEAAEKPADDATWQDGAWVLPPPPPDYKIWSNVQEFMAEFTMSEKAAMALSTDPTIAALRLELSAWLSAVHSNDSRVVLGLTKLVELDIVTDQRKTEILALNS